MPLKQEVSKICSTKGEVKRCVENYVVVDIVFCIFVSYSLLALY